MNHDQLAALSLMVYRSPGEPEAMWRQELEKRLEREGFELRGVIDRRDTQVMIVHAIRDRRDVAVVFRGTEPLRGVDVSTCRKVAAVGDINGNVHSGFAESLNFVYFEARAYLRAEDRVNLTGHSMGGALAAIMASRILRDVTVASLVTFGAPPSLSAELARMVSKLLNGSCVRYESADLVTMLLALRYRSPGHLYYITLEDYVVERAGSFVAWVDRVRVLVFSITARLAALKSGKFREALRMPKLIINHSMHRYASIVRAHCRFASQGPIEEWLP